MSTVFFSTVAVGSQCLMAVSRRFVPSSLFLDFLPFPYQGYTYEEFSSFARSANANNQMMMGIILVQLAFIVSSTILATRYIQTRSKVQDLFSLSIPTIGAGIIHAAENLCALAYFATNDSYYGKLAAQISPNRSLAGTFSAGIVGLLLTVFAGVWFTSIGQDGRQVVDHKEKKEKKNN